MKKQLTILTTFIFAILAMGTLKAEATVFDMSDLTDVETINGAIWSRVDITGSGTGAFEAFLRISSPGNSTSSEGYNTDGDFDTAENDALVDPHTHSINRSEVEIVNQGGTDYWLFRFDSAEPGSTASSLDLTVFEVYLLGTPDIIGASNVRSAADLKYSLDTGGNNSVHFNNTTGQGTADTFILIPDANFTGTKQWMYVYAEFLNETGSFEEWGILVQLATEPCTVNCTPVVPEPTSMILFGTGLVGAVIRKRFAA